MNKNSRTFAPVMIASLAALPAAGRDISITQSGTDLFNITEQDLVNGKWQVSVTASGNPSAQITVRSISGSNPIRYIKINSVWTTSAALQERIVLNVLENANTSIPEVGEIVREDLDDRHISELWVGLIQTSGTLGIQGDSSKKVVADLVSQIQVAGPIYGAIQSGPRYSDSSAVSTINFIRTSQGGIFGNVTALYGAIDEIASGADIGAPGNTVNIYAKSSIKSVVADSIWADIDSTQNGGQENIWYIKTRTGDCNGSIKAKFIDSTHEPSVSGLSIAGDLNANVTTLSHLREPIVVGGSVPASTTIHIGGQLLTRETTTGDNGSIIVAGDFAGTLQVGDHLYGPVNISGSLASSGMIRVVNDVFKGTRSLHDYSGSITLGDCAGLVRIGGSLSGPITCSTNSGLTGQVVINAANASGSWTNTANSLVTLKDNTGANVVLAPNQPPPRTAPYYEVASSGLGGGAIGLVPFYLHGNDCVPEMNNTTRPVFFDSAFNHRNPGGTSDNNKTIALRFYGPVYQNDSDSAIKITHLIGDGVDVTQHAVIEFGSFNGKPREITIHGTADTAGKNPFLPGTYRITGVAGELKCGGTQADPVPDAQTEFTYEFILDVDCNRNNRDDATDLAETVTYDETTYYPYDLNGNHIIDVCDREANGACLADINIDAFVNGNDYDLFSLFFENGHAVADLNFDGFVNGDDYDLFSQHFEAGC